MESFLERRRGWVLGGIRVRGLPGSVETSPDRNVREMSPEARIRDKARVN